jgi:tRNA G18 (ribose-2'-O)-methylase SpoU
MPPAYRDSTLSANYNSIARRVTFQSCFLKRRIIKFMTDFEHQRHKPPLPLSRPREMVIVCAPMRSNVNLSRIARAAGCCGITRIVCIGTGKLDRKIARDGADTIEIETHRTLAPVLEALRCDGYRLVGLEQTTNSKSLHGYVFARRMALVIGNERTGLTEEVLTRLDDVVEIPVWGLPYSHNVATAAAMALYEYCRQYPEG